MPVAMYIFGGGVLLVFASLAGAWWCQKVYKPSSDKLCPECSRPILFRIAKCPGCQASLVGRRLHSKADARGRLVTCSATLGTIGFLFLLLGAALSFTQK